MPFGEAVSEGTLVYGNNGGFGFKRIYCKEDVVTVACPVGSVFIFYPSKIFKPAGGFFCDLGVCGESFVENEKDFDEKDCKVSENSVFLDFKDGMLAELVSTLDFSSIEYLNFNQLRKLIEDKSSNPWLINQKRLKQDLHTGRLSSFSVKVAPLFDVRISGIYGTWHSDYFYGESYVSVEGCIDFRIPKGFSTFYNFEDDRVLSIFLENNGNYNFLIL